MSIEHGPMAEPEDGIRLSTHIFFFLCVGLCVGFGVWAWFGELDIVSVAIGEAKPSSQVKEIQHLEGGIVAAILVREGAKVEAGEALIELEATRSGADLLELKVRLSNLRIEVIRHLAEANAKKTLNIPADLEEKYPKAVDRLQKLFDTRRKRYLAEISSQKQLVTQRRQEVREIKARIANSRKSLDLLEEKIAISEELLKDQLTNRYNHIELLQEAQQIKSQIDEGEPGLKGAQAAYKESLSRLEQTEVAFREDARAALDESQSEIDELSERLKKFEDNLERTVLRAPVSGIVKSIHISTIGGVVKPGDTVVDVVPGEDKLIVEAQLPTEDIGYVQIGQEAILKLNAPSLQRFGHVMGKVVHISADKLIREEDGQPYYKVRIEPGRSYFLREEQRYDIFPGTQIMASIRTGTRSVIEYLLDPFLGDFQEAMRER
ncbi:MAG: Type I secretion system membrane fusion protein PrsE [Alphaproteobacteria bacterium MarineAlpha4_Bin2]|nr:MAG: Type I secretion system membrane fusion protein PrsE [Alphaproteobacteria bacterium MarineAlpha4_Bin2]